MGLEEVQHVPQRLHFLPTKKAMIATGHHLKRTIRENIHDLFTVLNRRNKIRIAMEDHHRAVIVSAGAFLWMRS